MHYPTDAPRVIPKRAVRLPKKVFGAYENGYVVVQVF